MAMEPLKGGAHGCLFTILTMHFHTLDIECTQS